MLADGTFFLCSHVVAKDGGNRGEGERRWRREEGRERGRRKTRRRRDELEEGEEGETGGMYPV